MQTGRFVSWTPLSLYGVGADSSSPEWSELVELSGLATRAGNLGGLGSMYVRWIPGGSAGAHAEWWASLYPYGSRTNG